MPSLSPRRIVVVGGVAGGMSFAARARRLDESADIIVFEKGMHPSFANCGLPYFVSGEITNERALLVQTPASLKAALNLDVRVDHEVVAIDPARQTVTVVTAGDAETATEFRYDELVLAPGTQTSLPEVAGSAELTTDQRFSQLRTVEDAKHLADGAGNAKRAVVLGGGYIGLEAAEALRMRGLDVHLVQRGSHVLSRLDLEQAALVTAELERNGVLLHTGTTPTAYDIAPHAITVTLANGDEIATDLVVNATGGTAATRFVQGAGIDLLGGRILVDDHGRTSQPHVWAVGDAVTHTDPVTGAVRPVELAGPANRDGRLLADAMLAAKARPRPAVLGTSVVRVFDLTVAATGANAAELVAAGIPFESVHLHPASHAGYFPDAETLHMLVHFAPTDGRVYGAQIIGKDGADKRIDVIATAMRGGVTADGLIDLDLAYAPPYGSAKDPVNMVGMVADNVLTGMTKHWYARDLEAIRDDVLILDVRRRDEWDKGHLEGALNVPHTELRDRLDEVIEAAAGRPVRAHCAAGMRSYLAHRILTAAGLDSASLSGGMQTLIATYGKGILAHEDN